uniref:WASH-4_N domain-containing protein n=1 Tax=Angiostrongylus cantonensis TaxID=6313 RepID=A0A0K0CVH7_ANGCA
MSTAQHNPSQFGVSDEELRQLIATISSVDGLVMAGNGLRNCYEQSYGDLDEDKQFSARMRAAIIELYNHEVVVDLCFLKKHFGGDKLIIKANEL